MQKKRLYRYIFLMTILPSLAWGQLTLINHITGITGQPLNNAQNRLTLTEKAAANKLTPQLIKQLCNKAPKQIKKAIEPYGYFKSNITSRLTHQQNQWTARYHVSPGPQLKFTAVNVKLVGPGKTNKELQWLIRKFPIKLGDAFSSTIYHDAKDHLLNTAQRRGYLRTIIQDKLIINIPHYTATLNFTMNTGPRFYFGPVAFSKTPLSNSFLAKYITFRPGKPFSYARLLTLQQVLSGSGYFKNVAVTPEHDKTRNHRTPVHVQLVMRKQKAYQFGVGYGTDTGVRGTLGLDLRWLNQNGHSLDGTIKLSQPEQSVAAQYIIPGRLPAYERYAISTAVTKQDFKDAKSLRKGIGMAQIKNYARWQRNIGINYEYEKYRAEDTTRSRLSKLLIPNITYSLLNSRNTINTAKGSRLTLTLQGSSDNVMSSVSFLQALLQYKWIHTAAKRNRFIFRTDLGYTAVHEWDKLPVSKRLYAGGIDSVRGYGYNSLGPGRYLAVVSGEYQIKIIGNWYAAVFYDVGNATYHLHTQFQRGAGIGIVWQSPMGALRFYLAQALSKPDKPIQLEFSFGPDL